MRAGRMNRRAVLQSPNPTRGADGSLIDGWTTVATVWAALEPVSGRDLVDNGRVATEITHKMIIRYRSDPRDTWRVQITENAAAPLTRSFKVSAITNPRDGRQELNLLLKELPDGEPV